VQSKIVQAFESDQKRSIRDNTFDNIHRFLIDYLRADPVNGFGNGYLILSRYVLMLTD
jgi:hypothetical protein